MAKNLTEWQLRLEKAAETMKALADPYRLHILDLLTQGEACHSELKEQVGLPPNLLSHHLRVLRQAGLVRTRHDTIDGRWIYYAANKDSLIYWRAWLGQFLDPGRVQARSALCGPEGRQASPSRPRVDEADRKLKRFVLFLCTGNSCRSQMAEAIVNTRLGDEWAAFSAGTQPAGCVHPRAVESLAEIGIDWRGRSAKRADEFRTIPFDLIVTLCDNAKEHHPTWLDQSQPAPIHLGFPDPARATGSAEEVRATFRTVRDAIIEQVPAFLRDWPRSQ
jgi:arsenate reductase (thioredoxin)